MRAAQAAAAPSTSSGIAGIVPSRKEQREQRAAARVDGVARRERKAAERGRAKSKASAEGGKGGIEEGVAL